MPFVPLGSRKRIEVVLDHDKERLTGEMRTKDEATVKLHHAVMPGVSGYRYANHPLTMGPVRGPPAPFEAANKPWAPPEHEPNGMAAMRDMEQAPIGSITQGAHSFKHETIRRNRSTPAIVRTMELHPMNEEDPRSPGEKAKEAANPISIELNRWKRLAAVTKRDLASMPDLLPPKKERPPPPKPRVTGALVNFPKYMLFEDSHMKNTEFLRFTEKEAKARQEHEARATALEEAMARGEIQASPASTSRETSNQSDLVPFATVSMGAPRLRGPLGAKQWAGSALPSGKSIRSSNPFRMG